MYSSKGDLRVSCGHKKYATGYSNNTVQQPEAVKVQTWKMQIQIYNKMKYSNKTQGNDKQCNGEEG